MEGMVREEMIAMGGQEFGAGANLLTLARELRSYRQLPQIWYRAEESYSFDLTGEGREKSYRMHEAAYCRIFDRCGCENSPVDSELGGRPDPPGDLAPEEFHTPGQKTIADIAAFTGLPETSQMKSLVMVAGGAPVLALVRGDHQLSEAKCAAVLAGCGKKRIICDVRTNGVVYVICEATTNNRVEFSATFRRSRESHRTTR
jgi:prolyl-tRNA synthetase